MGTKDGSNGRKQTQLARSIAEARRTRSIFSSSCSVLSTHPFPFSFHSVTFSCSCHIFDAASRKLDGSSSAFDAHAVAVSIASLVRSLSFKRLRCVAASAVTVRPTSWSFDDAACACDGESGSLYPASLMTAEDRGSCPAARSFTGERARS